MKVGKYWLGRLIGVGEYGQVNLAAHTETKEVVAIKIMKMDRLLEKKKFSNIRTEISIMNLIRHPNVLRLYEVMATESEVYLVLEYAGGGDLDVKMSREGRLKEDIARKYFQQLVHAVDHLHSQGVFHRDLKPKNLLLDSNGGLKVADFGLSALLMERLKDGPLKTGCGSPCYMAPEVLTGKEYDGAKSDVWSCGVILYHCLAGEPPFFDSNLLSLTMKISAADLSFPNSFAKGAMELIGKILEPDPAKRITCAEIMENDWFKKGYQPPHEIESDIPRVATFSTIDKLMEPSILPKETREKKHAQINAFDLISSSPSWNLNALFQNQMELPKRETRFLSSLPVGSLTSKIKEVATSIGLKVVEEKDKDELKLEGENVEGKDQLVVAAKIYELWFSHNREMVVFCKYQGDTLEFDRVYKKIFDKLEKDGVVWQTV